MKKEILITIILLVSTFLLAKASAQATFKKNLKSTTEKEMQKKDTGIFLAPVPQFSTVDNLQVQIISRNCNSPFNKRIPMQNANINTNFEQAFSSVFNDASKERLTFGSNSMSLPKTKVCNDKSSTVE